MTPVRNPGRVALAAAALWICGAHAFAQSSPPVPAEASETVIRSSVHEVLLDVVVRQKNLQLARKLSASDFTVSENGVPQVIKTFRFVAGADSDPLPVSRSAPHSNSGPGAAGEVSTKLEEPGFVSIVFDQLTPATRSYAQDAVHAFLARELRASLFVSIFRMDYRTDVIQDFTTNRQLLNRAVDRAVLDQSSDLAQNSANVLNQTNYSVTSGRGGVGIGSDTNLARTPDLATAGAAISTGEGAAAAAKIITDQRNESMYQGGMRAVTALLDLIRYEATLPGRKTVVYLSEGLNLPPDRPEMLRAVVDLARREGVTFYGIDVRGLSTFDENALAKNLARRASRNSRQPELVNQAIVANKDLNMDALATGTGGFAVFDTNEIAHAMQRVMQDVRTHYEITYTPASDVLDGHFRKVAVTVNNPKLTVQSRDGYFALPDLPGKPPQPYENAGLHALDKGFDSQPGASELSFHSAAFCYRPAAQGYQYEIAFEIPTAGISPRVDQEAHKARLHVTFVGLIKDARSEVVDKVSHEIDETVPEDKLPQFLQGRIAFTAPVTLAAGRYTLETAVTDAESGHAGVRRATILVASPVAFGVSDLSLLRQVQPLTGARDPLNPLEFQGARVTPDLTAHTTGQEQTLLFFVIYPVAGGEKPKVTVDFLRNGANVAANQPDVSGPDEANSIPVIAAAKLPAGDYDAKVTVLLNGQTLRRSLAFTVVP